MRAFVLMRDTESYPLAAVVAGAKALGYNVHIGGVDRTINSKDLIITWTPWRGSLSHRLGEQHKASGGKWIVMENGYISGAKDPHYAVGLDGFNGLGDHRTVMMPSDRWNSFGLEIQPWRIDGSHIALFAQMGGHDLRFTHHPHWPDDVVSRLEKLTDRSVVYRPKPSRPRYFLKIHENIKMNDLSGYRLEDYFKDAWATVVYNSKIAVESLRLGIPAVYDAPCSILKSILQPGIESIENPPMPDREQFFYDLAYAQWSASEIATGEPFKRILS